MDKFVVHGGAPLRGELAVAGAKNAALPLMAAALLTEKTLVLQRVPDLWDVGTMKRLLKSMGVEVKQGKPSDPMQLQAATLTSPTAPYDLVKTMRASILSLGPLLARCGEARVSLPGGCAIGARPVEQHIKGLTAMGAKVTLEEGYIHATARRLHGARITTDMVTVTGTENLMMAACLADGRTVLENAAQEPEVMNLAEGLIGMGALIEGAGTNTITIEGVRKLHGATHEVMADRIEAGTYLCAAAVTGGHIRLTGIVRGLMEAVVEKLEQMGCSIDFDGNALELSVNKKLKAVDIRTMPYPGFPTDLQAQFMAANCVAEGSATMVETIFENRFQHALELARLGANIHVEGRTAVVQGGAPLAGTTVMATDLRASAGLVVAALAARGVTTIERIYHLDRGYEKMEERLSRLGGRVERQ